MDRSGRLGVNYRNAEHGLALFPMRLVSLVWLYKNKLDLISVFAAFQRHQTFKEFIGNSYYLKKNWNKRCVLQNMGLFK